MVIAQCLCTKDKHFKIPNSERFIFYW